MTGADGYASLLDWRRQVADLYAEVRADLGRDAAGAHRRWRDRRDELFRGHPQSPLPEPERAAFGGIPCFDYDARFAFAAAVRSLPEVPIDVAASDGAAVRFIRFGAVDLPVGTLEVFWLDGYGGGVFLPFRDASSGGTTYGGGRYLLDTAKGADLGARNGELVLDFNFAYHPSCAHDGRWGCPLAPRRNTLASAIDAGERRPLSVVA